MESLNKLFNEWQRLFGEQDNFLKNKESFLNELNELEEKCNEFSVLNFSYKEWQQLQVDQKFLANGNELIAGINKCISMVDEGDISLNNLSREVQADLKNSSSLDERLGNINKIMNSIQAESMELSRELTNYLQNIDLMKIYKKTLKIKFNLYLVFVENIMLSLRI